MKYQEAKKYLKEGMEVKIIKCEDYEEYEGQIGIAKPDSIDGWDIDWNIWLDDKRSAFFCARGDWYDSEDELEILTNPDGTPWKKSEQMPNKIYVVSYKSKIDKAVNELFVKGDNIGEVYNIARKHLVINEIGVEIVKIELLELIGK